MSAITIPREFVYPVSAVVSTLWLTTWQTIKVGRARKAANIKYPQLYAEKAEAEAKKEAQIFNCAQRAHQNTLENLPLIVVGTLVVGTKYPVVAASMCGFWTFCRVLYTIGYSTGDPARRSYMGSTGLGALAMVGILFGATWTCAKAVLETL